MSTLPGELCLLAQSADVPPQFPGWRWAIDSIPGAEARETWRYNLAARSCNLHHNVIGLRWGSSSTLRRDNYFSPRQTDVVIPFWILTVATAMMPALKLREFYVDKRRKRLGLCPICGYDLRATPEQCPECGTAQKPV